MKSIHTYYILTLICFIHAFGMAQNKNKKSSNEDFDSFAHMAVIESYQGLLSQGHNETAIHKKLGNANYLNAKYDVAAFWYEKLLTSSEKDVDSDYLYRYALSLKSIKKYEESNQWMDKYSKANAQDTRAKLYANNKEYLEEITIPSEQYTIENLSTINSAESDFAPSYFLEKMVFSTTRDLDSEVNYNDFIYSNLYQVEIYENGKNSPVAKFPKEMNTRANESSTAFTKDGKTVYFTRNNFSKNSFKRDKKGVSRLKIYRAKFQEGKWSNAIELPFNNKTYSVAHPSLNSTEDKLYFSSDMPNSKGSSDIYVVDILSNGDFGSPKNLGDEVNTEGKETFPFISDANILYFASDGHPGLGGLDVFKVDLQNDKKIINLGSPINSSEDDFSIIMDSREESGYFASNRKNGKGKDDIYSLSLRNKDCFTFIEGVAVDKDYDTPLAITTIVAYNFEGEKIAETETNSDGKYTVRIPCQEKQYQLTGNKEGYDDANLFMLTAPEEKNIRDTRLALEQLSKIANVGSDLVKILELTPIYFDLNSSYLRKNAFKELDKVVEYMLRRPDIIIEIGSHTDSREEDNYNLWLSKRRAKRTVDYIISKGIASARISGIGYGETQLVNRCENGVICAEKDHQLNRRSEFIVLEK